MTTAIPFVPTPRLDYTMRYNEAKDDYRIYQQERQREQDRNEKIRLEKYQEEQRLIDKRLLTKELEDVRMYEALSKQEGYNDYKYAYWAGTLVDKYI
jgi:hypothetical protein